MIDAVVNKALADLDNDALVLMDAALVVHGGPPGPGTRTAWCRSEVRPVTAGMARGYGTGVCTCYGRTGGA